MNDMVALNCDVNHNKSIIINGRNDKDANLQNRIKFGKVISALMQKGKVFMRDTFPRCTQFSSLLQLYGKTSVTYSFLGIKC